MIVWTIPCFVHACEESAKQAMHGYQIVRSMTSWSSGARELCKRCVKQLQMVRHTRERQLAYEPTCASPSSSIEPFARHRLFCFSLGAQRLWKDRFDSGRILQTTESFTSSLQSRLDIMIETSKSSHEPSCPFAYSQMQETGDASFTSWNVLLDLFGLKLECP